MGCKVCDGLYEVREIMGIPRRAAKIDDNQPDIIRALKACGIQVEIIGKPVDLLVYNPRSQETSLVECKALDGRLTEDQVKFIARWSGPVHIVRSAEEAVAAVLGEKVMA